MPATGLNLSSTCTQCSFATLPSSPENFCVSTANSRLAPSAWLDEVRIFIGQFGQVRPLFSCSGGAGMISSCVTDCAPCRNEVPMQSEPVSPPPITTTCLPPARISWRIAERLAGDAAVLLRQEIHREVNAGEIAAGNRQIARGFGAAGQRHRVILFEQRLRIERAWRAAADRRCRNGR